MHNCKEIREQLTELVLNGADCGPDKVLSAELKRCVECRAEFDALNATLGITTRLKETVAPAESYWTGYHARLRERLVKAGTVSHAAGPSLLLTFFKSSVPVPVPVAAAAIIIVLVLVPFAIRASRQQTPQSPVIVHVPVEVPVIQERTVTQIVYRDRLHFRSSRRAREDAKVESTFARSEKPKNEELPASLTGFKPTEEIKLTVIKGGSPK
jgi:hypothetical protein